MAEIDLRALKEYQALAAARQRRIDARVQIAKSDPGRFSPFERNALLGLQHTKQGDIPLMDADERRALRNHEQEMLKQQGANAAGVEDKKNEGLIGVANAEAGAKAAEAKARFGFFDEKGTYHPGSDVESAKSGAQLKHELAWLNNQTKLDIANSNNATRQEIAKGTNTTRRDIAAENNETKKAVAETRGETARNVAQIRSNGRAVSEEQRAADREQRDFDAWVNNATNVTSQLLTPAERAAFLNMTAEEKKRFWEQKTGRAQQGTAQPGSGSKSWKNVQW